jgi:hypothetical protein
VALHAWWDDIYGLALIAAAVWLTLIYFVTARRSRRLSELRPRRFSRGPFLHEKASRPDLKDAGQQLNAVMAAPFEKRRLLNWSEYQAFKIIEADMAAARRGYRVFAQTSLGEVLMSPDEDAFCSINSKRVDILIVDKSGWPLAAVEYQGNGHYQGAAAARDAIKKEALRKAGVRYVEITATDSAEQIRSRVREQLRLAG